jgi:hypothetical protein
MILENNFYDSVLVEPFREGADTLNVVSGYATSAMAHKNLEDLRLQSADININLIVGMTATSGINSTNHSGFVELMNESSNRFTCNYVQNKPAVHSKLYVWSSEGKALKAFIGSANYTQMAFFSRQQQEILTPCNAELAYAYYEKLVSNTVYCNHSDVNDLVYIDGSNQTEDNSGLEKVTVPLISSRNDEVQNKGGLNWGQREGREPNQAYIQLTPEVYRSNFFPRRTIHFTILTDDNKSFVCVRAQKDDAGQAIETPHNNSLLGEYFRNRLGVANGAKVTKADLEAYGRTDVEFVKVDEETYFLDFSV